VWVRVKALARYRYNGFAAGDGWRTRDRDVLAYISRAWEFTGKKIEQYHANLTIMKNARNEN
jgi:hypothetical protein